MGPAGWGWLSRRSPPQQRWAAGEAAQGPSRERLWLVGSCSLPAKRLALPHSGGGIGGDGGGVTADGDGTSCDGGNFADGDGGGVGGDGGSANRNGSRSALVRSRGREGDQGTLLVKGRPPAHWCICCGRYHSSGDK